MWVFTQIGFFSATLTNPSYVDLPPQQRTGCVMIRARVREDLERLVDLFHAERLVGNPEILALPGHDYPYRIVVQQAHWAALLGRMARSIDYSNFKDAVEGKNPGLLGRARHDLYLRVWSVMHGAEEWLRRRVHEYEEPEGPIQPGLFEAWYRQDESPPSPWAEHASRRRWREGRRR